MLLCPSVTSLLWPPRFLLCIREALLQFLRRQLIWSIHPTVATQRGFWERNVLGKWRATAQEGQSCHLQIHAGDHRQSTSVLRPNVITHIVVNASTSCERTLRGYSVHKDIWDDYRWRNVCSMQRYASESEESMDCYAIAVMVR